MVIDISTTAEFVKTIKSHPGPAIAYFTAKWCGPCQTISPFFASCAADDKCANIAFLKVDVDVCDELAGQCGVSSMPTFIAYCQKRKLTEFSGADKNKLVDMINACIAQQNNE